MGLNYCKIAWFSIGSLCSTIGMVSMAYLFMREKGTLCSCKNRSKRKVIAITGANSGIGYEVALKLALLGAKVYICSRNEKLGKAAVNSIIKISGNSQVYFISLDLSCFSSCRQCADILLRDEEKLDILIHNAGIFYADPEFTVDGYELMLQTNFLGPVILTEHLYPILLEAPESRVIFVNSEAHKIPSLNDIADIDFKKLPILSKFEDYVLHYGTSKLALKLYAIYLAEYNKDYGISFASVNPGNVWTPVYRNCWPSWYQFPTRWMCKLLMRRPQVGAQSIIHSVNVKNITTGSYIMDCCELSTYNAKEIDTACSLINNVYKMLDIK